MAGSVTGLTVGAMQVQNHSEPESRNRSHSEPAIRTPEDQARGSTIAASAASEIPNISTSEDVITLECAPAETATALTASRAAMERIHQASVIGT